MLLTRQIGRWVVARLLVAPDAEIQTASLRALVGSDVALGTKREIATSRNSLARAEHLQRAAPNAVPDGGLTARGLR